MPETDSTPSIYYTKVSITKHKTFEFSHISGGASGGGGRRKGIRAYLKIFLATIFTRWVQKFLNFVSFRMVYHLKVFDFSKCVTFS
jgi:hypothetical protein